MKHPQPAPKCSSKGAACTSKPKHFITGTLLAGAILLIANQDSRADYILTNAWRIPTNAAGTHVAGGDVNRSIAYSVLSNQVYVCNKGVTGSGTAPAVDVFDGTTGTLIGSANVTGIAGGTFLLDQIAVADDGVIYGGNLNTAVSGSSFYRMYRWADWTQPPTTNFIGDPTLGLSTAGKRVGDTIAIRGSGIDTLIMVAALNGTAPTTNMMLFSTTDGINFTPTILSISGISGLTGGPAFGFAFYTNNTFLFKPNGSTVYIVQYPANFASQSSPVAATAIASVPFTSGTVLFDCNTSAGLLAAFGVIPNAGSATTTTPINLYGVPPVDGLSSALASTNSPHPNANGNVVGGVALGGAGKTNYIYTVDCNNGVQASGIAFVPPQPPSISVAPIGTTGSFPPYTLSVTASGSKPLTYQWRMSPTNTSGTFTNIPGATTNAFTVAGPGTNYYVVYITNGIGSVTSSPVLVSLIAPTTNAAVSLLWRTAAGASGFSYLSTDDNTRGLAYDTNSSRLVVASVSGGDGLYILNANNGTNIGTMNLAGALLSGTKHLDQVGIADDGAVYSGNLALTGSGDAFHLTRWDSPTTTATAAQAYNGDPGAGSGERWGDYMAVRGAGPNTQVVLGSKSGTNVALLTTSDGINFNATLLAISNAPAGFAGGGICFGAGNTFWAKNNLAHLYEIAFDPVAQTGGVLLNYSNPGQIPSQMVGVGVDTVRNILAGVVLSDSPHDVQLFQLTGSSDSPILFHQAFFASATVNGNANAAIVVKYPRVYALDVNNGLLALTYGVPAATAPTIVTPPANTTAYTNDPAVTLSVSVSGSLPLFYQWRLNSNNIPNATNGTYVLSYPTTSASGYYDVIVHNVAGYATSTPPALLTIVNPTLSTVVTQIWTLAAGSRAYLDSSSYQTRGLAYDTNTATVCVADHFNIYLLAGTDGSDIGQLNTLGLPSGGVNSWTVDQLGVADDGVLYSCNLTLDGSGFAIIEWPSISSGAVGAYAFGGASGADPSGTGDRWGDTMDVRGAGAGTEILCGSANGTHVVLFNTADGSTFASVPIQITNAPAGFAGQGIAFGLGNTFWAKSVGYNLRLVAYDPSSGLGGVLQSYTAGTDVDSGLCGIDVDNDKNILAGISFSDNPNDMRLYSLSGNSNPPGLFDQAFFGSKNLNSQNNAVTVLKSGKGFGLDVNNGLVALTYGTPAPPSPTITNVSHAAGSTTLNWLSFNGRNYQVQFRSSLTSGSWASIGAPIVANGPVTTYTDSTASGNVGFYRILAY
jgi:hypothetical protein